MKTSINKSLWLLLFCSFLILTSCAQNVVAEQHKAIEEIYDIPYYSGEGYDDVKHKLNLFLPENVENPPMMLWIHGGAWAMGGRKFETELAQKFASKGIAVAVMSYRLSSATWHNPDWDTGVQHPEHIKDVARAFAWVHDNAEKYKYDQHSIFVSGYSAGAHLAALLAMDPTYLTAVNKSVRDIKGAIPIAGAYDIVSYYNSHLYSNGKEMADSHVKASLGNTMKALKLASPTSYINNQWIPMLVISETDTYDYTKILEKSAQQANYETMEFVHVSDKNHAKLYEDLAKAETSLIRNNIIDYINKHKVNYSYLKKGNTQIAYKVFGEGAPLFLLNGGPGFSSHNFQKLAKKIAVNHQIILFDQRGTGYSKIDNPNATNVTLDLMVEDLEALRKHLGFEEVSLMGQSFGGIYAMSYAAKYPNRVSKMILSHSGGPNLDFVSQVNSRLNQGIIPSDLDQLSDLGQINNPDLRSLKRSQLIASGYVFNKEKKDIVFKGLAFNSKFYPEINQLVWQDMRREDYNVVEAMQRFKGPVLILHGDQDIVDPKHAQFSHSIFSNSKLVIFKDCIHYGWIDSEEIYFKELFTFLES